MLQLEKRHRDTDMVIEVPLCRMGIELHRKHSLRHFLCSGLAITSGNGDLLQLEKSLIALGKLQEGFRRIIDWSVHLEIRIDSSLVYNAHQSSILFHLRYKLVGVKASTLNRPKDNALSTFTRIHAEIHLALQGTGRNADSLGFQNLKHFSNCQIKLQHQSSPSPQFRDRQNDVWSYQ